MTAFSEVRKIGAELGELRRRVCQMCLEHEEVALAGERGATGEAVEEDTAERVDVGTPVDRKALDLLRRCVVDGPEERARAASALWTRPLGEPEVAEVEVASGLRDEDVRRLHVAVEQSFGVRGIERATDLLGDRHGPLEGQRAPRFEQRVQAVPGDVAHRQVEEAVDLPGVEDRDHVRVVEGGSELRLDEEARAKVVVVRVLRARSP